jgi:hypothetical protein
MEIIAILYAVQKRNAPKQMSSLKKEMCNRKTESHSSHIQKFMFINAAKQLYFQDI